MDDRANSGTDRQAVKGEKTLNEEFRVSGEAVTAKARELLREGNMRRIVIENDRGELIAIPLTVGVVGALLLPVWVGVSAVAALAAGLNLSVRRVEDVKVAEADVATSETLRDTSSSAQRVG